MVRENYDDGLLHPASGVSIGRNATVRVKTERQYQYIPDCIVDLHLMSTRVILILATRRHHRSEKPDSPPRRIDTLERELQVQ